MEDLPTDDDYGSEWGDIDDQDMIAAVDEAERAFQPPREQGQLGEGGIHFRNSDGLRSGTVPKTVALTLPKSEARVEVYYPSLVSTLTGRVPAVEKDAKEKVIRQDAQQGEGGVTKTLRRAHGKGTKQGV